MLLMRRLEVLFEAVQLVSPLNSSVPTVARLVPLCGSVCLLIVGFLAIIVQTSSPERPDTVGQASDTNTGRRDGTDLAALEEISWEEIAGRSEPKAPAVTPGFEGYPASSYSNRHQVGAVWLEPIKNDPSSIVSRQ